MLEFGFRLQPASTIEPWGPPDKPNLSWFALTLGEFWIEADGVVLFQYSSQFMERYPAGTNLADYQVAAFVREVVQVAPHALSSLPPDFEALALDWPRLFREAYTPPVPKRDRVRYTAFRWLCERSLDTGWLNAFPQIFFLRVKDEIVILWNNAECLIDGIFVWSEVAGSCRVPCEVFHQAVVRLQTSLLSQMSLLITEIEEGIVTVRAPVSITFLREQHESFRREFEEGQRPPDFDWHDTAVALGELGINLG